VFTVQARAGSEGRLFGSVTSADIVAAVESQSGVKLDRKRVQLDEPIKTIGTHSVPVKLHSDVEFPVTIDVVGE
jgi:large subunit ribosomal protein L9